MRFSHRNLHRRRSFYLSEAVSKVPSRRAERSRGTRAPSLFGNGGLSRDAHRAVLGGVDEQGGYPLDQSRIGGRSIRLGKPFGLCE